MAVPGGYEPIMATGGGQGGGDTIQVQLLVQHARVPVRERSIPVPGGIPSGPPPWPSAPRAWNIDAPAVPYTQHQGVKVLNRLALLNLYC